MRAIPTTDFAEAASVLREQLDARAEAVTSRTWEPTTWMEMWRTLSGDGWLDAGTDDIAQVVDLVELSETWGRYLIPLPFSANVVIRRHWRSHEAPPEGLGAIAIKVKTNDDREVYRVPFAGIEGVWIAAGERVVTAFEVAEADSFAPSLQCANVTGDVSADEEVARDYVRLLAAEAVGAAAACCDAAVAYSRERVAYGQPIGSFQAVQHLAAEMFRAVDLAKSAAVWAASAETMREVAKAAVATAELARTALEKSIQIYGGAGVTWELGLHWYLRHVVELRDLFVGAGRAA
jgi:hypothetical protein